MSDDVRIDTGYQPATGKPRHPDGCCQTCGEPPANGVLLAMPGASPPVREHCAPCVGAVVRARLDGRRQP